MSGEAYRIVKTLLLLESFKDEKQMVLLYWEEHWIYLGGEICWSHRMVIL